MLETYFLITFSIQVLHSLEEIFTNFHSRWYLYTMQKWHFIAFEVLFTSFWLLVYYNQSLPARAEWMLLFLLLMFANGVQHIVWFGVEKKYVPGLVTAFFHIIAFVFFYFSFMQ